jgi:hypothetical protein
VICDLVHHAKITENQKHQEKSKNRERKHKSNRLFTDFLAAAMEDKRQYHDNFNEKKTPAPIRNSISGTNTLEEFKCVLSYVRDRQSTNIINIMKNRLC